MTNFEGGIMEDKGNNNYEMDISGDNDMFQNWSFSFNNLDEHMDSTISSAYAYDPGSLNK